VLQQAADTLVKLAAALPDEQLTPSAEGEARTRAAELCAQAVEAYVQVAGDGNEWVGRWFWSAWLIGWVRGSGAGARGMDGARKSGLC
jgi:hypothetical protein